MISATCVLSFGDQQDRQTKWPNSSIISSGYCGQTYTTHLIPLSKRLFDLNVASMVQNYLIPSSKYIGVNEMNIKHAISISEKILQIQATGLFHDCAGSSAIKNEVISRALAVSMGIHPDFDVFPTGRNSVQFEYEEKSGKYIELEIFCDKYALLYMSDEKTVVYENDNIVDLRVALSKAKEFYEI